MRTTFFLVLVLWPWIGRSQTPLYNWTTIAGLSNSPALLEGTNNVAAVFNNPRGLAADGAGNLFVADSGTNTIRKLTPTNGGWIVSTLAGSFGISGNTDGTNAAARFANSGRMQGDAFGNIFIQDIFGSPALRRLTPSGTNWIVTTLGNNGAAGFPGGLAVNFSGSIFSASNYAILRWTPLITNGLPAGSYTATTIAGLAGFNGSVDGTNGAARFTAATQVLGVDGNGVVFLSDGFTLRTVAPAGSNWVVTTLPVSAQNNLTLDAAGNVYGTSNQTIQFLAPGSTNWLALGGAAGITGVSDGTNSQARFTNPGAIAVDGSGNAYVADSGAGTIRLGVSLAGVPTGTLQVNLATDSGTNTSMAWRVDAGASQTNGAVVTNLQAGSHVISFAPVFGWVTPTNQLVVIGANQTSFAAATYAQLFSSLTVSLSPPAAVAAGAAWQVDGGAWQTNGGLVSGLTIGNHLLAFTNLPGWTTPTNQTVSVVPFQTTTATGNYLVPGAITATITPAGATNAGAQWQLDGGSFQNSGVMITNVAPGAHVISYLPVNGWSLPATQTVTVVAGQATNVSGVYLVPGSVQVAINPPAAVTAGAQWALDGGAWQPSGFTLGNVSPGLHTINYLPLTSWQTPATQTVAVVSGQFTNLAATYVPLGTLQVSLGPTNVLGLGAVWRVDGAAWQTNGAGVTNLAAGTHVISYTNILGWATPANQTVTIALNQTLATNGVYVQQFGNLQVSLSPAGAVGVGAQWQLDNGAFQNSGVTLTNIAAGNHLVSYAPVAGWTAPTNQTVTITSNQTTRVTAIYSGQGAVQIFLQPTNAISAGAMWQVDGGNWLSNGTVVANLNRGNHTIGYKPAIGWVTPATQTVSVVSSQTTITNGFYFGLGYNFTTIAGTAGVSGFQDGTNRAALFATPGGMVVDAGGNLLIADTGNSVIRKLSPGADGWTASTIAGLAGVAGSADGVNSQARFNFPSGLAVDASGNIFVADQVNSTIRKISPDGTNWIVSTIAGLAGSYGNANGTNNAARFFYPAGLAVDAAGNVFVADQINSAIRKLTPAGGTNWAVTTIAGTAGVNGSADGVNNAARFYWPSDLKVDAGGTLFVADAGNSTVRRIVLSGANYVVSTIAGSAGINGAQDGTNNTATFDGLGAIALDALGNLYVADSYSSTLRKVTPIGNNWIVNTIGGLPYNPGSNDGATGVARFNVPYGICADAAAVIYVADTYNQAIRAGSLGTLPPFRPGIALTLAGTNVVINWQSTVGLSYQLQFKTNLLQPAWVNLGPAFLATNSFMPFVDTAATTPQRFYRVYILP
jgi:hypothetical protein